MSTETANAFFTVLTLLADGAVVVALLLVLARPAPPVRRLGDVVVDTVGPSARRIAFVVALVATLGSLYYSEIAHYTPCRLCWYQRICMYPLAVVLLVGLVRRDRGGRAYAWPFVIVGVLVSTYHWLVERVHFFERTSACSDAAPCSVPWFQTLGFVTLAFMAGSAFLVVGVLLLVERAAERSDREGERSDREGERGDPETAGSTGHIGGP